MLDKNTFCRIMNEIIKVNEKLDMLQEVNSGMALSIVEEYSLQDELITLLELNMNLPVSDQYVSTISWWIYDANFGKDRPIIYFNKDKQDEEKFILDTVEKLYDFCKQEGESNA